MPNSNNWGGVRANQGRPVGSKNKSYNPPTKSLIFRLRIEEIPVMQEFYKKLKAKRK